MAGGASELLGRESCAGPLLVGLSWGKPQLFHLGMSQWASELMWNKHKMHDAHLTEGQTVQSVALIRILLPLP